MSLGIKKTNFCNNCGKIGHLFHQCKIPITSIGLITIRKNIDKIEILLICRKDSLSFVDFMRGKYNLEDLEYIKNIFNKMTKKEKDLIKTNDFEYLWQYLWGYNSVNQYKNEEKLSKLKFNKLKNGYYINNKIVALNNIIENCNNEFIDPEWGFPKGRRNYQERDIMCGLREFEEETGYLKSKIMIINNLMPLEEIFTSFNFKSYKHKYFIGYINDLSEPSKLYQDYEISKIKWVDINEAVNYIRNYNIEKKNIIIQLNNLLKNYKLLI